MIRALAFLAALFITAPAFADQIDVILKFADMATAKADFVVASHYDAVQDAFAGDRVIPNVKVWRASQDVGGTDGQGNPTVTHTFLPGYFVLISLPRVVPALRDHAAVQIVINRDKANARQAGMTLRKTVSDVVMQDLRFSPVFAGFDPPWGAWQ